ncbi:Ubiquitin/ISG15-conjugating enzyme E2 L6 like protein [Verticillium longisporum]|uniref:Ubiquitin/ISG15-conjugating enzyme E2 L6 like protein n=1 Tax=Verticillium longisporum TaxID=100787 RepID=A0A8I2ZQU4_VERLO|nr:Ubiquitin/ISG15-conjugating enzyme E2 L6 like protein [Verticillium longisporum]
MSNSSSTEKLALHKRRLLCDLAELQEQPYPHIQLHVDESNILKVCLVLTPPGWIPIHLTVMFPPEYPLLAPYIHTDTYISHPNVFGNYLCASILNTAAGWTPAYTLKGVAIQMLSFFTSETLEQDHGGGTVSLLSVRNDNRQLPQSFDCERCEFKSGTWADAKRAHRKRLQEAVAFEEAAAAAAPAKPAHHSRQYLTQMPAEILLTIIDTLEFRDLTAFAQAWTHVSDLIAQADIVRLRELQCFCTKASFNIAKLGVGVSLDGKGANKSIESEFDLLSEEGFGKLGIRKSVHGINFSHWLPLPISQRHWAQVRGDAKVKLTQIGEYAGLGRRPTIDVLAAFMNDIVVRLNKHVEEPARPQAAAWPTWDMLDPWAEPPAPESTLRHASEKAIESYLHLFHMLVCCATEDRELVETANRRIRVFASGQRHKSVCPNLGHLLVYLLISDVEITELLRKDIITEAITRNVVWLFDKRGADMPDLSYLEPDAESPYRLKRTFEGGRTSYRLLMFSELFRRTVRPGHGKPLQQVREELFDRHGAPPRGAAAALAAEVRRLHEVDNFYDFFREMGLEKIPGVRCFTAVLRATVKDSMSYGYSSWGLSQDVAYVLRRQKERGVGVVPGLQMLRVSGEFSVPRHLTFFPSKRGRARLSGRRR